MQRRIIQGKSVWAGALSATLMVTPTFASAGGSQAQVAVPSVELAALESVVLPLTIALNDGVTLGAVTVELQYDVNVAELTACIENPLANPDLITVLCNEPSPGIVRATGLALTGAANLVTLIDLQFTGLAAGTSPLALAVETIADPAGLTIEPVQVSDGMLVVTEGSVDADGDGVSDSADNCIDVSNPLQIDSNADGIGNVCDADIAGAVGPGADDCTVNFFDLGRMKAVFFGNDADADLVGPAGTEPDGVVNFSDLGRMKEVFFTVPGPSGLPNDCEE